MILVSQRKPSLQVLLVVWLVPWAAWFNQHRADLTPLLVRGWLVPRPASCHHHKSQNSPAARWQTWPTALQLLVQWHPLADWLPNNTLHHILTSWLARGPNTAGPAPHNPQERLRGTLAAC